MTFYSKLTRDLKRQFKTSDILIPETRAQCVAVAQRVWEGLNPYDQTRIPRPKEDNRDRSKDIRDSQPKGFKDPQLKDSRPKDPSGVNQHHKDYYKNYYKEQKTLTCFKCGKEGHYANTCPNPENKGKVGPRIQSTLEQPPSPKTPSRLPSPTPRGAESESESDDSLN
jgi:hypothetical protein